MTGDTRGSRARASWTLADQAVSSLTNVVAAIVVARSVSAESFGAFTLAFLGYTFVLGVAQSLVSEPLLVRYRSADERDRRAASACAVTASLLLGVAAGAVSLAFGGALGGDVGRGFLALAPVLPGLLLQDAWRFVAFGAGRPARALANDLVWAGAQVLLLVVVLSGDTTPGAGAVVLAWGAAGWIAGAVGFVQWRLAPSRRGGAWLLGQRDLGVRFAVDFLLLNGSFQVGLALATAVAGLETLAGVRAAQVLLGPLTALQLGLRGYVLAEGADRRSRTDAPLQPWLGRITIATAAVSAAWGLGVSILPSGLGEELVGDSWQLAEQVLPLMAVAFVLRVVSVLPAYGLRVVGAGRALVRARIIGAPLLLGGAVVGAALATGRGVAGALAIAFAVSAAVTWEALTRALRDDGRHHLRARGSTGARPVPPGPDASR